jgi:hypothetical protein
MFQTDFTFQLSCDSSSTQGADGITFTLQIDSPHALGFGGTTWVS